MAGKFATGLGLFDPDCFTFVTRPMNLDQFYKSTDHLPVMKHAQSFVLNLELHDETPSSVSLATDLIVKMAKYSDNLAGIIVDLCEPEVLQIVVDEWHIPTILRVHETATIIKFVQKLSTNIFALLVEGKDAKNAAYSLHYYREYFLDLPIISEGGILNFVEARDRFKLGAKAVVLGGSVSPMFYQNIYDDVPTKAKPNELSEE